MNIHAAVLYARMSCDKKYTFDKVIDKIRDTMRGNGLTPPAFDDNKHGVFELALIEYLKDTEK